MPPLRNGSSLYLNASDKISRDMEDRFYFVSPSSSVQQSLSEQQDDDDMEWDPDEIANIPEPPDGGYGWVIVAASFLSNMIVDGIAYTFGIFFTEFVRHYDVPKGKVAWVGSLLSGFYMSVGPIVSALTNRFGSRLVMIAGSLVSCTAMILSTMAPTIDVLMVTYGVMGGIGFGLVFLPAVVSVSHYFSTKRALATGVAVCGSGVGAFVFAPLCQVLLNMYEWQGALLILAGLTLNCAVFGGLMRPLDPAPYQKPLLQRIAEEKERHRMDSLCESQYMIIQHSDGTFEKRPKFILNLEPGVHSTLYLDQFGKSPADTPVFTLSPIQEVRKSPELSKEDEMNEKEENEKEEEEKTEKEDEKAPLAGPSLPKVATTVSLPNAGLAHHQINSNPNGADFQDGSSSPQIANGTLPPTFIRELAKRKGLLPQFRGAMKLSLSNMTVNNETKKNNAPLKISSSGFLCPGQQQNNNFNADEVWKQNVREQISQTPVPLDGSRRSSLRRERRDYSRPMYRKDVFYSGSIRNLPEYKQSQGDVRSYVASVISIPRDIPISQSVLDNRSNVLQAKPRPKFCPSFIKLPKSMTDTLYEMLDISLLQNKVFLMICMSNVIGMIGFYVPYVYITDSCITKGIPAEKAAFVLSMIGITNTIGRLLFGWIADRPGVSSLLVNNVTIVLTGICVFCIPFCNDYTTIVIDCVLFGLFVSAYICLTSIILVELLGLDKLTNAFGLLSLFRGASVMLGAPVAGSIYDWTGSYDLPFFIAGILLIGAAIISFLIPCVAKREEEKQQNPEVVRDENQDVLSDDQESVV
ncbi:monocarboxylate transporter 9 isoform X2 [Parasteatoda tepidariorum]|uniref:monocarboxylate transporter 9 isoform X2 n=1 Tax=Parasteatoda tepidariorum TaxID=114398 RepID=UPI00077FC093|nr:monocarboxylate transporter 12 isoform X2 [Parasteatoda tepidariorum]